MLLSSLTETQKGAIGEGLVVTGIIMGSGGRLSPFKAVADDGGIDLLVYDKHTGRGLPLQVKSRTKTVARQPNIVHFQVRLATLNEGPNGMLLAILANMTPTAVSVRRAWLIPMSELRSVARERRETLVIRPSQNVASNDQFSKYRCEDMNIVAQRLMTYFDKSSEPERGAIKRRVRK